MIRKHGWDLEATAANRALAECQTVVLEKDVSDTDQDGRLLRYVYVKDTFVNLELVIRGLARVDVPQRDKRYASELRAEEQKARDKKLGLWSATPTP